MPRQRYSNDSKRTAFPLKRQTPDADGRLSAVLMSLGIAAAWQLEISPVSWIMTARLQLQYSSPLVFTRLYPAILGQACCHED